MPSFKNVYIPNHPLVSHNLAIIRDKNTEREMFLSAFKRISTLLVLEGLKHLPSNKKNISTPISETTTDVVDESYNYIIAPILRAGLAFTQTAVDFLPFAHVLHIGMYRDEKTHQPHWYYDKSPATFKEKTKVFILDPMLATGGSALASVELFLKKGVKIEDIMFISLLSAPEGIKTVQRKYPELKIITGAIDKYLNDKAYIVPGLGDAGDRYFNSIIP